MATHSSILAWKIPWAEEPGGLQSIGPQRLWPSDLAHTHTLSITLYLDGRDRCKVTNTWKLRHVAKWLQSMIYCYQCPIPYQGTSKLFPYSLTQQFYLLTSSLLTYDIIYYQENPIWEKLLHLSSYRSLKKKIMCQRSSICIYVHAQSCLTLCDPVDCSLPGSSVIGISQARILEWVAYFLLQNNYWSEFICSSWWKSSLFCKKKESLFYLVIIYTSKTRQYDIFNTRRGTHQLCKRKK